MSESAAPSRGTTPDTHDSATSPDRPGRHAPERSGPEGPRASTSAAAVFSLVFGLIAILAALTGLLAPVAVVAGLIGLILAIVGIRAGKKPLKTGRGTAIGGLVLSVIALLLGAAAIIGVASTLSSNPQVLDQISNLLNQARSQIPG